MLTETTAEIQIGTIADYDALSRFHYRVGRPATVVRVLRAAMRGACEFGQRDREPRVVGVLVISMPALNGPWRAAAWPEDAVWCSRRSDHRTHNNPRSAIEHVNSTIRVINRVVVDPRVRGLGVGRALVRAYLDDPITIRTEAIAAMGVASGMFLGAGMREVACSPSRRVVRLAGRLKQLRIEPLRLADPSALVRSLDTARREALASALRSFAAENRDTRASADAPLRELIAIAARRVCCVPRVYVGEKKGLGTRTEIGGMNQEQRRLQY